MTESAMKGKKGFSASVFLIVAICTFAVLIADPAVAIEQMREGLIICSRTVIPSLFPFMVLSGLFVELGCSEILARLLGRPIGFLFGISKRGCAAPIMGALCGFPIGALTAHRLYEKGEISKNELQRLIAFSNIPSSAFLISSVGSALWSNKSFGLILYIIQLICMFFMAFIGRFFYPRGEEEKLLPKKVKRDIGVRVFTKVVSEAAFSMLNVCALVLFFASVIGAFISLISDIGVGREAEVLIYGFFEMSGGVSETAALVGGERGMIITALICGWSGLSIHFQVISVCHEDSVSFAPYFLSKAVGAILSAVMMIIYLKFIDPSLASSCIPTFASTAGQKGSTAFVIVTNAALIVGFLIFLLRRRARR